MSEIKKTLGESKNSKKDSLPGRVNGDLGRSVVMPFFVLVLAISSLIVAVVAFHSDNTSTQYQSGSDGLSTPGDMYSAASSPEASGIEYQMSSWAPTVPQLIYSNPYVIYTSVTVLDSESFDVDLSPHRDIRNRWLSVSYDAQPFNVPEKVGTFETALEGSVCTFSSDEYLPVKGNTLLSVPVMYPTTQPTGATMQALWLIDVHFIDTLINSEGALHVT